MQSPDNYHCDIGFKRETVDVTKYAVINILTLQKLLFSYRHDNVMSA